MAHTIGTISLTVTAVLVPLAAAEPTVIHVDASASGANDGTSWNNAFVDLHDALAVALEGDQLWVAAGTYITNPFDAAPLPFMLVSGVHMYGGFAGSETDLSQRDWEENETTLRGQLTGPVLIGVHLEENSVLDGFTITNGAADVGGGLQLHDSMLDIANSTFTANFGDLRGGAIFASGSSLMLRECTFRGNFGLSHGGAIESSGSTMELEGCMFDANASAQSASGGALYVIASNVSVRDCTFRENTGGSAAAMYSSDSEILIDACHFINNGAIGATVYWHPSGGGSLTITESVFEENGGEVSTMWIENANIDLLVENTSFVKNVGGGMSASGGNVIIRNCEFIGNDAFVNAGGFDMLFGSGSIEIEDCLFHGNHTDHIGGGIRINLTSGSAIIRSTQIASNTAAEGGGLVASGGDVQVHNSLIEANGAFVGGGAAVWLGSLEMIGTTIRDNGGGGLLVAGDGALTVLDSIITGNGTDGVLVAADSFNPGQATITNSLITGNFGNGVRVGLGLTGRPPPTATITNSTIANNTASFSGQAGVVVVNGSADVRNSILWGNGEGLEEQQVLGETGMLGDIEISHSIIQNLDPDGVFDAPGAFNLGDDPLFVNPFEGDFRLQINSPAIDAGSNAFVPEGITTDLDGNPRFVDGLDDGNAVVDIGAYEFQPKVQTTPGDLNGDGIVNHKDIVILVHSFGPCPAKPEPCPADLNGDGIVNAQDLLLLLGAMTPGHHGESGNPAGQALNEM